jgi:hypothetical protein
MRPVGVLLALLAFAGPVQAGELLLVNGSRLQADLANERLLVSTGSDLVEVAPETIGVLTRDEVRLKDGRVLRGTLVGGRVRARTSLGELAIDADELRVYRADGLAPKADAPAAPPTPPPPVTATAAATSPPASVAAPRRPSTRLEVVIADTPLHRDALANGPTVGSVRRGEQVTYVDSIDRRLRILNTLIFDGGHWIKVRAADGTEGWLPAATVREVR